MNPSVWLESGVPSCTVNLEYDFRKESLVVAQNFASRTVSVASGSATLQAPVETWVLERELFRKAINNRTRERNYANLCLRLSEGQITEDEFDREIEDNEDRYAISFDNGVPENVVRIAARLTEGILDVETEDDFKELFSISSTSLHKALEK